MHLLIDSSIRFLALTLIMGSALQFAPNAEALTYAESMDSMITRAELIFIGTLKEVKSFKDTYIDPRNEGAQKKEAVKRTALLTESVFSIDQLLKGSFPHKTVEIRQAGGRGRWHHCSTVYCIQTFLRETVCRNCR